MMPTNPSYIRRIVKAEGGFERVRVSPSNGDVHVKVHGGGWQFYANTSDLIAKWEAERRERRAGDFQKLTAAHSAA